MSQAGPQQLITAFCPLWSELINQQPLLLLGASPSGNVHVGLGCFPSPCVPDVHHRRACGGAFTGATKLVPHGCSNRRFKAALWRQVSCSHFGDTCAKHPHVLARDGGKQGDLVQLVLHPSSLSHHTQTLSHPHRLLQKVLLFPGMFLSKLTLIGLRKKKEIR